MKYKYVAHFYMMTTCGLATLLGSVLVPTPTHAENFGRSFAERVMQGYARHHFSDLLYIAGGLTV